MLYAQIWTGVLYLCRAGHLDRVGPLEPHLARSLTVLRSTFHLFRISRIPWFGVRLERTVPADNFFAGCSLSCLDGAFVGRRRWKNAV